MIQITITDQQARDLLFALDFYLLDLEAQRAAAARDGRRGRSHVLASLIGSYNETYHSVNEKLAKALEEGGTR